LEWRERQKEEGTRKKKEEEEGRRRKKEIQEAQSGTQGLKGWIKKEIGSRWGVEKDGSRRIGSRGEGGHQVVVA